MERAELETGVTDIVRDLMENDDLRLDTEMSARDLPGWDSFTQVNFVAALEDRFGVQLALHDVERWRSLGDVLVSLHAQLEAADPGER